MTADPNALSPVVQASLVASAAANLAGWHDAHVRALGIPTEWCDGFWLAPDPVPPIFFDAIAVRPGAASSVIAERIDGRRRAAVSDPWADLALAGQGFTFDGDHAWMVRAVDDTGDRGPRLSPAGAPTLEPPPTPSPPAGAPPPGLVIEQVRDADALADFERAAVLGFGSPPHPALTWHAPGLLDHPRLQLWRGRVEGETVAVAMGFADAGVLGIYGVATLPEARGRGYGTALTRRAIDAGPRLPAVLQPSTMAEHLYGRLGFRRFTTFLAWDRPMVGTPRMTAVVAPLIRT